MPNRKLVRDKIPYIIESRGKIPRTYIADEGEYLRRLKDKLRKEVGEYLESKGDIRELADILEVVYALADTNDVNSSELERIRLIKKEERGGFENRIVLEGVDDE